MGLPYAPVKPSCNVDARDAVAARMYALPDLGGARSTMCYQRCERALVDGALGDPVGKRVLKLDLQNEAVNTRLLQWLRGRGAETFGIRPRGSRVCAGQPITQAPPALPGLTETTHRRHPHPGARAALAEHRCARASPCHPVLGRLQAVVGPVWRP